VDFPLLHRIALPVTVGSVRYPGIKIHETRLIRLMEVLLHGGTHVGGWTAKESHETVLTTFGLSQKRYRLNQLRYGLRKLKGHGAGAGRTTLCLPPHERHRKLGGFADGRSRAFVTTLTPAFPSGVTDATFSPLASPSTRP
jgi:hypothetical protein